MTTPFWAAFIPDVPLASSGRRGLFSQTSTPVDEEAGDPHVVVLEDEHPAAELGRARPGEDVLDHPLAGPVGRMGLAGEHDLDRPLLVPQQPGQPVHVAEQQAGPLVGREPAGEADRQDVRVERRLELLEDRRRLAVAGELVAQPAPGEDRQLELLALVGAPQLGVGDARHPLPEAAPLGLRVEVVEVGLDVAPVERRPSRRRPRSARGRRS